MNATLTEKLKRNLGMNEGSVTIQTITSPVLGRWVVIYHRTYKGLFGNLGDIRCACIEGDLEGGRINWDSIISN